MTPADPQKTDPQKPLQVAVPYKYILMAWAMAVLSSIIAVIGGRYGIEIPPIPPPPMFPDGDPKDHEPPPGSSPKEPEPSPLAAIVRISSGNTGCSATVIGPRRPDGRYWVLTAAHCVSGTGQRWTMRFRDGRTVGAQVVNFNKAADWCWMVTDGNNTVLPHALIAETAPAPGTAIWHAGYGVHIPANREDGVVVSNTPDQNGQIRFRLSVSSGDSGGGMVIDSGGRIVSTVCCTTAKGKMADVWGASPEAFRAGQRDTVDLDEWKPMDIPIRRDVVDIPKVMPAKK